MSGEIVVAAPIGAAIASIATLPIMALIGTVKLGSGALTGAISLGAAGLRAIDEAAEKKRIRQEAEIAMMAKEIDKLARSRKVPAADVPSGEMIAENQLQIKKMLENVNFESLDIDKYASTAAESENADENLHEEYRKIYNALSFIDPDAAKICRERMGDMEGAPRFRQKIIHDNLRIEYGNALRRQARALWRAKKLREMVKSLDNDEAREFEQAIGNMTTENYTVEERDFKKLIQLYAELLEKNLRHKQNALLERQILARMKNLGYKPINETSSGSPIFFATAEPEYRIMARVNPDNGQISFRFVRVVATEQEKRSVTTAQKRRDMEQENQWCANARNILNGVSEELGIDFEKLHWREPGEDHGVLVIVDSSLCKTGEAERVHVNR